MKPFKLASLLVNMLLFFLCFLLAGAIAGILYIEDGIVPLATDVPVIVQSQTRGGTDTRQDSQTSENIGRMQQWQESHDRNTNETNAQIRVNTVAISALTTGQGRIDESIKNLAEKTADMIWWFRFIAGAIIVQLMATGWSIINRALGIGNPRRGK